ncbi:uncharacterized protein LY89DRAFT_627717 [Mollisia scopiformis]|uniref:Inner kinetochore subunit AME1 domain-containing protein n=1 Tax=Mollisia scopiformis TaxID=149040 RepID=A0A132BAV6_MOLSC|nr:uncharacterized protein LY89DRAFT_627717 [Mollisia scopiformis]KUJ09550.1 hypothetical protein LY89DRAFT_627717 [Mollisia scopiformis]
MMASREERMQQRLRGAQRRQVKDVDFGLVFPGAAPEPESEPPATLESPQLELPQSEPLPQLSSRRTPASRQRASNAAIAQEISRPPGSHSTIDANTSAKRRKLDTDDTPVSSARSTRSRPAPRPDVYTLRDDPQDETALDMLLDTTNDSVTREPVYTPLVEQALVAGTPATRSRAKTPLLQSQVVDEVTESPKDAPGSGQRVHTGGNNAGTSSSRRQSIQGDSTIQTESETPIRQKKRKRPVSHPRPSPRNTRRSLQNQVLQDTSLELDELSPEQTTRHTLAPELESEAPMSEDEPLEEEPEEAEAISDEQAAMVLKKNKGRRISRGVPNVPADASEQISSPMAKKRRGKQRKDLSPVQQRHAKQAPPKTKQAKAIKKVRLGSPIPITIHRFTNPLVYDDDEADADILNSEIPQAKRPGVNTIDVLSEVCGEVVAAALQTLDEGGTACDDAALRREYKIKWQAVAAFGKEIQTRLLEHTINLDNGYSLERRLRDEQKKKLRLRDEILRIRAEREQVALHMDEVRIKHENAKMDAQKRDDLNANVHDIEMAIDLGKQKQHDEAEQSTEMVGTEVLLKRVAGEVSNKSDSGGLLRQIKDFNAFLERAALALEGKMV